MAAIVIASPLFALARVDDLGWLQALFKEMLITAAVLCKVLTCNFAASGSRIGDAITAEWIRVVPCQSVAPPLPILDEDEAGTCRGDRTGERNGLIASARTVFVELH